MTVPAVEGQYYPTLEELRDVYLRSIAGGAERRGLTVNLLPGSEFYLRAEACAMQVLPIFANNKLGLRAVSPLDATGDQLTELCSVFGVTKRAAASAAGFVTIGVVSGSVTIPAGYVCTARDGSKYETVSAGTYADAALVEVIATVGGSDTNKGSGEVLQWDSSSVAYLRQTATVSTGALTGGADEDDEETLRGRLLKRLSEPGQGGNRSMVQALAENASASVADAFVYSGVKGPGSYGVCVVKADGDRTLSSAIVNLVASAIVEQLPGHTDLNCTTATASELDICLKASLPFPTFAGGVGGGWRDASPWPNATSGSVKITAFNSGTGTITTDATTIGTLAVGHHIGIWSPDDETMYEFVVASRVVNGGGFVDITVVGGFSDDFTGHYISAGAEKLVDYAAAFLLAMQGLGPGEKTSRPHLLPRALRWPSVFSSSSYAVASNLTTALQINSPEFLTLEVFESFETGTTTTRTTPAVPAAAVDPPAILTLGYLSFIRA
jgi:uncharacterized phage protein gp47/JayE